MGTMPKANHQAREHQHTPGLVSLYRTINRQAVLPSAITVSRLVKCVDKNYSNRFTFGETALPRFALTLL